MHGLRVRLFYLKSLAKACRQPCAQGPSPNGMHGPVLHPTGAATNTATALPHTYTRHATLVASPHQPSSVMDILARHLSLPTIAYLPAVPHVHGQRHPVPS